MGISFFPAAPEGVDTVVDGVGVYPDPGSDADVDEEEGGGGMVVATVGRRVYPCAAGVAKNSGSSNDGSSLDTDPCTLLLLLTNGTAALMGVGEVNN